MRFSVEDCYRAIKLREELPSEEGLLEAKDKDKRYRDAETHFVENTPQTQWLFERLFNAAVEANRKYWQFDITGFFQPLQLVRYRGEEKQHYAWHLDIGSGFDTGRKISISLQLSNPADYDGGELELSTGLIIPAPKEQGAIVLFPSYVLHRVTPVTRGERWVIVGWVQGQDHFR